MNQNTKDSLSEDNEINNGETNKKKNSLFNRKMRFTIDYVCTDVLEYGLANPFQSEIRLFEGLTAGEETLTKRTPNVGENGKAEYERKSVNLFQALEKRLNELGFEDIDKQTDVNKEENHVQ